MAFSSPPAVVSIVGDADLVRHIHLPDLGKSFSVWSTEISPGKTCFVYRETVSINFAGDVLFDDVIVQVPSKIKHFSVLEFGGANNVIFAWDDGYNIWSMAINFATGLITASPNKEFEGTLPTLTNHSLYFRIHYTAGTDLKSRIGFSGAEIVVADVSGYSVLENDTDVVSDYLLKYTAVYGPISSLARPFQTDVNSVVLVDCEYSETVLGTLYFKEVVRGINGDIGQNVLTNIPVDDGGEAFEFTNPGAVTYPGILFKQRPVMSVFLQNIFMLSVWTQTNTGSAINTTFLYGTDVNGNKTHNIHLPWSDGNIYWDCGNTGATYDRINKAASVSEYAAELTNWVFYKNVNTGTMEIYRNGVLWHSGAGKIHSINDAFTLSIANNWPGILADMAVFTDYVNPLTLYNLGPNPNFSVILQIPKYHWTANNDELLDKLTDLSGNNNDLTLNGLNYRSNGVEFDSFTGAIFGEVPIGNEFTIEAWIIPAFSSNNSYVIEHDDLSFGFNNEGKLFFEFLYSGSKVRFYQDASRLLDYDKPNYIAVSHVFGAITPPTFFMLNGSRVRSSWASGTGKEAATITSLPDARVRLNRGGRLLRLHISNIARSESELLAYLRGRS